MRLSVIGAILLCVCSRAFRGLFPLSARGRVNGRVTQDYRPRRLVIFGYPFSLNWIDQAVHFERGDVTEV